MKRFAKYPSLRVVVAVGAVVVFEGSGTVLTAWYPMAMASKLSELNAEQTRSLGYESGPWSLIVGLANLEKSEASKLRAGAS